MLPSSSLSGVVRLVSWGLGCVLAAPLLPLVGPQSAGEAPPAAASRPTGDAPAGFEPLAKSAQAARAAGELDEAAALYGKALQLRPRWTEGRLALGEALFSLHLYPEARAQLQRVTSEAPRSGSAWALLGLSEFQLREHQQALACLQKGRRLGLSGSPRLEAVADYHAGILLARSSEFEEAFDVLGRLALAGQDSPGFIDALGVAALRLPCLPSEAPAEKREVIRAAGQAMLQFTRDRSRHAVDELVTRFPEEPNAHYLRGTILLSLRETADAVAEFHRVLSLQPKHVPALLQLALQLMAEGRHREARPYAERAVQAEPAYVAGRIAHGRVLLELDHTARAVAELEAAVKLAPDSALAWFHLSRAYQKAGRTEDAKRARDTFARLDALWRQERERTREPTTPSP